MVKLLFVLLFLSFSAQAEVNLTYELEWDWDRIEQDGKRINKKPNIFEDIEWNEAPSSLDWTIFYALQILDVYTTYDGLKYDCVEEANPIFGKNPTVEKMLATKFIIIYPAVQNDIKNGLWQRKDIRNVNTFMSIVVANNINVSSKARRFCSKKT